MPLESYNMGNATDAFESNCICPQNVIEGSGVESFTREEAMSGKGLASDSKTLDTLRNDAISFGLEPFQIDDFECAYYSANANIYHYWNVFEAGAGRIIAVLVEKIKDSLEWRFAKAVYKLHCNVVITYKRRASKRFLCLRKKLAKRRTTVPGTLDDKAKVQLDDLSRDMMTFFNK